MDSLRALQRRRFRAERLLRLLRERVESLEAELGEVREQTVVAPVAETLEAVRDGALSVDDALTLLDPGRAAAVVAERGGGIECW